MAKKASVMLVILMGHIVCFSGPEVVAGHLYVDCCKYRVQADMAVFTWHCLCGSFDLKQKMVQGARR